MTIDDALKAAVQSDGIRTLSDAAICAGLLALDRERHAATVQKCFAESPILALLMRTGDAAITDETAAALCNATKDLVTALTPLSPAAQLLDWGNCVPIHHAQSCRVDGVPVLPREVTFAVVTPTATLARSWVEISDAILRALLDAAPEQLDLAAPV
jgi:hypothetical protein